MIFDIPRPDGKKIKFNPEWYMDHVVPVIRSQPFLPSAGIDKRVVHRLVPHDFGMAVG